MENEKKSNSESNEINDNPEIIATINPNEMNEKIEEKQNNLSDIDKAIFEAGEIVKRNKKDAFRNLVSIYIAICLFVI